MKWVKLGHDLTLVVNQKGESLKDKGLWPYATVKGKDVVKV